MTIAALIASVFVPAAVIYLIKKVARQAYDDAKAILEAEGLDNADYAAAFEAELDALFDADQDPAP